MLTTEALTFLRYVRDNNGRGLPSHRALSASLGIAKSSVGNYLSQMCDEGLIGLANDKIGDTGIIATITDKGLTEIRAAEMADAVRRGDEVPGAAAPSIALDDIQISPLNPRKSFDKDALNDLAATIREFGLIEPIVLKRLTQGFELVAGERRWRACIINRDFMGGPDHLTPEEYIIKNVKDDEQQRVLALIENLQRVEIPPLEEAAAFDELAKAGWDNRRIAEAISKTIRYVELRRQLTANLIEPARLALAGEQINLAMARELATCDAAMQGDLLPRLLPLSELDDKDPDRLPEIETAQDLAREIKWMKDDAARLAAYEARKAEQAAKGPTPPHEGGADDDLELEGGSDDDDDVPPPRPGTESPWEKHRRIGVEFTETLMAEFVQRASIYDAMVLILLSLTPQGEFTDLGSLDVTDTIDDLTLDPSFDHSNLRLLFDWDPDDGEGKIHDAIIGAFEDYSSVTPGQLFPIERLPQTLAARLLRVSFPARAGSPLAPFIAHLAKRYGVEIPVEFQPATDAAQEAAE